MKIQLERKVGQKPGKGLELLGVRFGIKAPYCHAVAAWSLAHFAPVATLQIRGKNCIMHCNSVHKLLHTVRKTLLTDEAQKHTKLHRSWQLWAWKDVLKETVLLASANFSSLRFWPSTANKPWLPLYFFPIFLNFFFLPSRPNKRH